MSYKEIDSKRICDKEINSSQCDVRRSGGVANISSPRNLLKISEGSVFSG